MRFVLSIVTLCVLVFSSATFSAEPPAPTKVKESSGMPALKDPQETLIYNEPDGKKTIIKYIGSPLTKEIGQNNLDPYFFGKLRPYNCSVCGHKVNMPTKDRKYQNVDSDLCPHNSGNVRFISSITICPNCGFSAFQADFRKPQADYIKEWVKANLQPSMDETLHKLLGQKTKITHEKLMALFEKQSDIPDTLRTMNAYSYYKLRMDHKDPEVNAAGVARVAWMTAWSFRRTVCEPVQSGPLLFYVRKINHSLKAAGIADDDVEGSIKLLTQLFQDTEKFDDIGRQVLRIIQAGYYNRFGLNSWAHMVLLQANTAAMKKYQEPAMDPWFSSKSLEKIPPEQRIKTLSEMRFALSHETKRRDESLRNELDFLGFSVLLIEDGLRKGQYEDKDIPAFTYIIGEFERRREMYSRSLMWLDATRQMIKGENPEFVQHYAGVQIDILKRYVTDQKVTPQKSPREQTDWQLLQVLAKKYMDYRASAKANQKTAPADKAPAR